MAALALGDVAFSRAPVPWHKRRAHCRAPTNPYLMSLFELHSAEAHASPRLPYFVCVLFCRFLIIHPSAEDLFSATDVGAAALATL